MHPRSGTDCDNRTDRNEQMRKLMIPALLALFLLSACYPFIHGAVKVNDLERVKGYVAQGHVNDREETYQHTPLIMASHYGYKEIALYLLENGAEVNAQGIKGGTALIFASYYNYPEIAKALLDRGASVDVKDNRGHTALFYAEEYGHKAIVEMLEQAGATK